MKLRMIVAWFVHVEIPSDSPMIDAEFALCMHMSAEDAFIVVTEFCRS